MTSLRNVFFAAACAAAFAAPALAADAVPAPAKPAAPPSEVPACDDPQVVPKIKELTAGLAPEAQGKPAAAAKVAAELVFDGIKEEKYDAGAKMRQCYANPTLMRGTKDKQNVFGDVGIEYQITLDPATPGGVKYAISTVARKKGK